MSTGCPQRKVVKESVVSYWSTNQNCSYCVSSAPLGTRKVTIGGVFTGGGGMEHRPDELALAATGEWIVLTPLEYEQMQQELAAFVADLSQEGIARDLEIARFYGDRGLELMRIQVLDHALVSAQYPDVSIAMELAEALERAGFAELALQTWDALPTMIVEDGTNVPELLGDAMFNRGRILESLQRPIEAENAFAVAQHMRVLSEIPYR